MRIRSKRILFITFLAILVAAVPFAFREYRERREIREEEALEKLEIDSLEIKGATFDEALRLVVEKVHAVGHRELQLRIYANGRDCPYFRGKMDSDVPLERASTIDLRIVPGVIGKDLVYQGWTATGSSAFLTGSSGGPPSWLTLHLVLVEIESEFGLPCCIRGHELVAAHTPGTLQRYRKATIRLDKYFWDEYTDQALAKFPEENGIRFYEGMTIKFRREQGEVEFVGPRDWYDIPDTIVSPHPDTRWNEAKNTLWGWWISMRLRSGF